MGGKCLWSLLTYVCAASLIFISIFQLDFVWIQTKKFGCFDFVIDMLKMQRLTIIKGKQQKENLKNEFIQCYFPTVIAYLPKHRNNEEKCNV